VSSGRLGSAGDVCRALWAWLASGLALAVRLGQCAVFLPFMAHGSGGCGCGCGVVLAAQTTTQYPAWSISGPRGEHDGYAYLGQWRDRSVLLAEKRKVDSSILSLTTSTGYVRRVLASGNVVLTFEMAGRVP